MEQTSNLSLIKRTLKFVREGWIWILLPTIIVLLIVLLIILFGDPYKEGALQGKFIIIYSFFGGY